MRPPKVSALVEGLGPQTGMLGGGATVVDAPTGTTRRGDGGDGDRQGDQTHDDNFLHA